MLSPLWLVCDSRQICFSYMKRDESPPAELAAKSTQNLGKGEKEKTRGLSLTWREAPCLLPYGVEGAVLDVAVWGGGSWGGDATRSRRVGLLPTRNGEGGRCGDPLLSGVNRRRRQRQLETQPCSSFQIYITETSVNPPTSAKTGATQHR